MASPPQIYGWTYSGEWWLLTCWGSWKCLSSPLGGHRGSAPLSAGQAVLKEGWTRSDPAVVCACTQGRTPSTFYNSLQLLQVAMLLAIVDNSLHGEDKLWLNLRKPVQDTLKMRGGIIGNDKCRRRKMSVSGLSNATCPQHLQPIRAVHANSRHI